MKHYDEKSITFVFSCEGSVFLYSCKYALPNAVVAIGIWYALRWPFFLDYKKDLEDATVSQIWYGYNWVVGFLVSFRVAKAYARWWEGGTLLQQARGEWFNAYSSLIAFCSDRPEKQREVFAFQQLLARLVSMLYAAALQTVAMSDDLDFELVGYEGIEQESLGYLLHQADKCELIIQWIQRLIVENINSGVVPIAPPILSRAFQELSRGVVNMHNVRKISEFQFPYPFAQMISCMLLLQWLVTPFYVATQVGTPLWAGLLSFVTVFAMWGVNHIAVEIEQPFGEDPNDLPMQAMQTSMNASIESLLQARAQKPPTYSHEERTRLTRLRSLDEDPLKAQARNPATIVGMAKHISTRQAIVVGHLSSILPGSRSEPFGQKNHRDRLSVATPFGPSQPWSALGSNPNAKTSKRSSRASRLSQQSNSSYDLGAYCADTVVSDPNMEEKVGDNKSVEVENAVDSGVDPVANESSVHRPRGTAAVGLQKGGIQPKDGDLPEASSNLNDRGRLSTTSVDIEVILDNSRISTQSHAGVIYSSARSSLDRLEEAHPSTRSSLERSSLDRLEDVPSVLDGRHYEFNRGRSPPVLATRGTLSSLGTVEEAPGEHAEFHRRNTFDDV